MARQNLRKHIKINGYAATLDYQYPRNSFPSGMELTQRNRNQHGSRILNQLDAIRQQFDIPADVNLPEGILRDDSIYVDFISDWGHYMDFSAMEQDRENPSFQILNIREETEEVDEHIRFRYHVTLMMTEGGVGSFITKIEDYINRNGQYRGQDTGNPRYYKLFANIETIQAATLKSFWTDAPEYPFPDEEEDVWWEAWFRKTNNDDFRIRRVLENLAATGVQIGQAELVFAEHRVRLIKGTPSQLSQSILLLDNLSELRKPQETSDFICHRDNDFEHNAEWLDDLAARTENAVDANAVLVCLLDSGVNNNHPLIGAFLPDERLYSYKQADWGTGDDWPDGG
ncbi:MAG: hypothetical protein EOP48_16890, partial [Sphingobacteriales bacterium]